jgi:dTDP-glucose pyrophosphorylase
MSQGLEAMIFAAGQALRLLDLGAAVPKSLLPVWKDDQTLEPLLARIIRQAATAGAQKIRIVVNHRKRHIERFVKEFPAVRGRDIEFVHQQALDGEAGGLFLVPAPAGPTLAIDADNYLADDVFFRRLAEEYFKGDCEAAIGVCPVADITRYANVRVSDENTLLDIVEKPSRADACGDLAKMGCYVLSPALVGRGREFFLDSRGQVATTAAFSNLCGLRERVRCVRYDGYYLDIGELESYARHLTREDAPP